MGIQRWLLIGAGAFIILTFVIINLQVTGFFDRFKRKKKK